MVQFHSVWWYRRRRGEQKKQPAGGGEEPKMPVPVKGVESPVYEDIEFDNKKNEEMYEHPNFKPSSTTQNEYEDLEQMYQSRCAD